MSRRLKKELEDFKNNPPENCSAGLKDEENFFHWNATIIGPKDTIYEDGIFKLEIDFPINYPFNPPKIHFKTKIYHPNINKAGCICLDVLKDKWSPALNITQVLLSVCSLLNDPNPNDPLEPEIAHEYINNRQQFNNNVKSWIQLYAN